MKESIKKYQLVITLAVGILGALLCYYLRPFQSSEANMAIAIGFVMIFWWIAEIIPMPMVALIPLIAFPLLGLMSIDETAKAYANPVIFLFMGGFMIGLAIEKWNLHKRIALNIVRLTGTSGNKIILGFVIATGFLSMWLSNTATTMMMFPIALSVIKVINENETTGNKNNFSLSLMLVIAYASNFGGMATIIGTPPNVAFVAFIKKEYNYTIQFFDWMLVCTPVAILLLGSLYIVLTKFLFPNCIQHSIQTQRYIANEIKKLGPISNPEFKVLLVFIFTALLWITKDVFINSFSIKIDDNMIAVFGAFLLFIIPSGQKDEEGKSSMLMEWNNTTNMAWGILLLFGGGIALANVLEKVGIIKQIGTALASGSTSNIFLLITIVTIASIFLSEVMSNVAQVIVLAPVIAGFATAMGMNPLFLGLPMTLAASAASMLPMGTPPNAIVFSSGHIKLKQMLWAGLVMNIISIILIIIFCYYVLPNIIPSIPK
jgi:solute carrier family 13 (sodium-dependent dicarboxylate transporter), member 2/3/5